MSNPSGYRYTCFCQQNKFIVHMCSHYMIEKLLMFYKILHTGYLFFSIMKSRAFLTRILSHIRKTHMNHVIQIFKDRTKAISRAEVSTLLRVGEASLLMSSTWMMKLYDALCINNRNISEKLYKNNFFTSKRLTYARTGSNLRSDSLHLIAVGFGNQWQWTVNLSCLTLA